MDAALAKTDFNAYLQGIKDFTRDTLIPNDERLNDHDGIPGDIVDKLKASACYRSRFSTTLGQASQSTFDNGTEAQCREYLPELACGDLTGAFTLTEEMAGSDAGGVQITAKKIGGTGYLKAHPVEPLYCDARRFRSFEGTSQIQQLIIARHMVREEAGTGAPT